MMVARALVVPLLVALVAPLSATSPAAAASTSQAGVAAAHRGAPANAALTVRAHAVAVEVSDAEAGFTPPLSTRGRYIVDATGVRFKLKSGNWHGASGTWNGSGDVNDNPTHPAAENSGRIPLGLDRAPIDQIVSSFREIGLNSVRLPFSDEMIGDPQP